MIWQSKPTGDTNFQAFPHPAADSFDSKREFVQQISMREPKVKPLCTLVLSRLNIINLLLARQLRPSSLATLVPRDIVVLHQIKQNDIKAADSQQDLVAADVERSVVFSVDVCADDVAGLHEHVVQSC